MAISTFDIFKVGIGPSSTHTTGPMRAGLNFATRLAHENLIKNTSRLEAILYGSLGATGKGHRSDIAILLGLEGYTPETIDPNKIDAYIQQIRTHQEIRLFNKYPVSFNEHDNLTFCYETSLPFHPNGMQFSAFNSQGTQLLKARYYSIGGGFVVDGEHQDLQDDEVEIAYPFSSALELIAHCQSSNMSISSLMLENEKSWRSEDQIRHELLQLWQVMKLCGERGCQQTGILPGGLNIERRAAKLYASLSHTKKNSNIDPLNTLDWVNAFAIAVNEENAAGGRVVTAPTNGAAGIIPAVLHYYTSFYPEANDEGIIRFLLTAAAIGILYKKNASISGAEVGCQGEVGSACSMAAGALTEVMGGTLSQIENAAEIAMEHNLGLTCDPIGGLVQAPCIERNAMAAVKAINASRLALRGDGSHVVSLDKVIKTMRETGHDMQSKYKETSQGGLATNAIDIPVNVIEC